MRKVGRLQRRGVLRLIVAVLYAVCILAPHAALAVSKSAAHCLTDRPAAHMHQEEGAAAHMHADDVHAGGGHADGAVHQHAANGPEQMAPGGESHAGMCCGLFCLTALAPASVPDSAAPSFAGLIVVGLDDALSGRSPERITRPPIV